VTDQSMGDVLRVVGIAGSLRRASYNRALLCAAQQLTPPSLVIEIEVLDDLPMFNADLDGADTPEAVTRLRGAVREADGLLLVTPEFLRKGWQVPPESDRFRVVTPVNAVAAAGELAVWLKSVVRI